MNKKEAELVTEDLIASGAVYNLCPGGNGGFGYINENMLNYGGLDGRSKGGKTASYFDRTKGRYKMIGNTNWVNASKFQGKTHTDEWKENHSAFMKENQKGSKNSQFGTMWITNGTENKKIKKDLDIIPEGWYKGRK
jgi:hypothetical protein